MATLAEIFKFEEQLESGFAALLNANVLGSSTVHTADFSDNPPTGWTTETSEPDDDSEFAWNVDAYGKTGCADIYFNQTTAGAYLVFEGLTVGNVYSFDMQYYCTSDGVVLKAESGAVIIAERTAASGLWTVISEQFTASSTTLYVGVGGKSSSGSAYLYIANGLTIRTVNPVANTYYRRSTQTKATPFVDVLVEVGPAQQHKKARTAPCEDMYDGRLTLTVATSRTLNPANHHAMLSACRVAMLPGSSFNDAMGNLSVEEITPSATSYDADDDTAQDRTTMAWDFVFAVKPSAWPS